MAQQLGAIRYKGKIANVVGFSNSASSKSNKNFVRERASQVANPQTYKQAKQRAKAKPAQMFYAAFEPVLNHAFLPTGKASKNRNRFMKLAMALPQVSDVVKDGNYLPLCNYQVSEGSLGVDTLCKGVADSSIQNQVNFGLRSNIQFDGDSTIAQVSESILNNNPQLTEGQEITIIAVCGVQKQPIRFAATLSFVLDKSDTVDLVQDISNTITISDNGTNLIVLASDGGSIDDVDVLAAALIISSKTKDTWRYSNSFMALSLSGANSGLATESDVIKSYQSTDATKTSGKILQQADNRYTTPITVVSVELVDYTVGSLPASALKVEKAAVAILSDGSRRVAIGDVQGEGYGLMFGISTTAKPASKITNGYCYCWAENDLDIIPVFPEDTSLSTLETIDVNLLPEGNQEVS